MIRLANLKPILDSDVVLHVRGRLSKMKINFKRKHQIISPRRHYFTQLVIHSYHQKVGHSDPAFPLGSVHSAYWISSGINTLKHYLKTCFICIKHNAKPVAQMLGDLPLGQLLPTKLLSPTHNLLFWPLPCVHRSMSPYSENMGCDLYVPDIAYSAPGHSGQFEYGYLCKHYRMILGPVWRRHMHPIG